MSIIHQLAGARLILGGYKGAPGANQVEILRKGNIIPHFRINSLQNIASALQVWKTMIKARHTSTQFSHSINGKKGNSSTTNNTGEERYFVIPL